MTTVVRHPARTFDADGRHTGPGPWLAVIHQANRIVKELGDTDGMFGAPDFMGPWWAGGYVEEYPTARVIFDAPRDDDPDDREKTVRIVGKTPYADLIIAAADDRVIAKLADL